MGTSGTMAVNTIMIRLEPHALKATAVGLLVAIPCVVMNNVLRRRVAPGISDHVQDPTWNVRSIRSVSRHPAGGRHAGVARHRADHRNLHQHRSDPGEPREAKEAGDRKDVPVVVTLTANGELFLNDRPIPADGLKTVLLAHPRESLVVVRADKVTVLERFVAVVDRDTGSGFQSVSLEVVRL